jgi:3-oxoacyl-[acyl-carrier protein] reductase
LFKAGKTPEQIHFFEQQSAFGRLGKPGEIAEVVAFLAGAAAGWISGQNLRANGGLA